MLENVQPFEIPTYYGLNTKVSRAKLAPGFSPDTDGFHDIDLSQPGIAKTRGGSSTINLAHLLPFAPKRIFDYFKPSTNTHTMIGNGGSKVFTMSSLGVPSYLQDGQEPLSNRSFETWTGLTDLLIDGAMEVWTNPTTLTNWNLGGAGATLTQGSPKVGTYSACLKRNGTDAFLYQNKTASVANKTYVLGGWVYCDAPNIAKISVSDAVLNTGNSSYHTGNSTWQYLTAVVTCSAGATVVRAICNQMNSDGTAYFDDLKVYEQLAPTSWILVGSGATVSREEGIVYSGTYSAHLLSDAGSGAGASLHQSFHATKGIAYWKGRTVTCGMWVLTNHQSRVNVIFYDGVNVTNGAFHTGGSGWEYLTVTAVVGTSATEATAYAQISAGGAVTAYFDLADVSVESLYTSGEIMDFLNYKDSIYYSNGVDAGHVWDGTTERLWGITAPTAANTFASDSAGGLTGAYQYAYTYFDSVNNGESSASPFSAVHTVSTATINLTGLVASTDPQVDQIRIYRTTNGGALFLLVATINNGVTTYADNTTDTNLGTEEVPIYNDPPGLFLSIEEWDGRIWGFEKNSTKVSYSNDEFLTPAGQGVPWESFGANNFLDFNLKVYAIKKAPNFNELWVHTTGGVYAITRTGIAEDPYNVQIRNSVWFTEAYLSVINIYNDQWFLTANDKWMALDSSGYLSYKSYNIEPTVGLLNPTKRPFIQAVHYRSNSKNQFRAVYADGSDLTFSRMLAANYLQLTPPNDEGLRLPVWEYHNIASTAMGIVKDSNDEDILYIGTGDGRIVRQDIGADDDGTAINWSMSLGWLRSSVSIDETAVPRFLITYFKPLGDWFFSLRTDFDFGAAGGQVYSIKSAPTGDKFDLDFIFDVSQFAGVQDLQRVCTDLSGNYSYAEMTWFGNVAGQVFEMHNNTLLSRLVEGFRR